MKISSNGSLFWSTYLGGNKTDQACSIAATNDGSCYIVGDTHSTDFPTLNAYDSILGATSDIFIVKFVDTPLPSTPSTQYQILYGFLVVMAIMLFIVLILYKSRN